MKEERTKVPRTSIKSHPFSSHFTPICHVGPLGLIYARISWHLARKPWTMYFESLLCFCCCCLLLLLWRLLEAYHIVLPCISLTVVIVENCGSLESILSLLGFFGHVLGLEVFCLFFTLLLTPKSLLPYLGNITLEGLWFGALNVLLTMLFQFPLTQVELASLCVFSHVVLTLL